jgi:hypothetical protein
MVNIDSFALCPWSDEIIPVPPYDRYPSIRVAAPEELTPLRPFDIGHVPRIESRAVIKLDGHLMAMPRPRCPSYRFVVYVEAREELERFMIGVALAELAARLLHLVCDLTRRGDY